jgi:signal transduction histidine kinase
MHRSSSSSTVVVTARTSAADASHVLPTRGPPADWDQVSHANGAAGSAEVTRYLIEDRDRIAQSMNDVVVRRIFAAGLDLQAALGLIGEHSAGVKICHAIDELDLAIRDIRSAIFDRGPRAPRSFRRSEGAGEAS